MKTKKPVANLFSRIYAAPGCGVLWRK